MVVWFSHLFLMHRNDKESNHHSSIIHRPMSVPRIKKKNLAFRNYLPWSLPCSIASFHVFTSKEPENETYLSWSPFLYNLITQKDWVLIVWLVHGDKVNQSEHSRSCKSNFPNQSEIPCHVASKKKFPRARAWRSFCFSESAREILGKKTNSQWRKKTNVCFFFWKADPIKDSFTGKFLFKMYF